MLSRLADARVRVTTPEVQAAFKRGFDASPTSSGPMLGNRLGGQVARTLAKNAAIEVRRIARHPEVPDEYTETLDRDGIVVIPDYLPHERYQRLAKACEDYLTSPSIRDH